MLRIDCLLKDTEIVEDLKTAIRYLGSQRAKNGEDASFSTLYREMRKAGIEVDAETAAKIYENELTATGRDIFTPSDELKYETGSWFDNVVRNITLQKPKEGEKEISDLSPAQAVVKGIADTFSNNVVKDNTTKSILKTLEDLYREGSRRLLGELPNKPDTKDLRTTPELVQQALENENIGYRNLTDGTINNLAKIHEEVRRQIGELTKEMEATGDYDKIEQWNNYAKSMEDAQYSLLFKSKEAEQILHDSLKEAGFTKTNKEGKEIKDWQKLTGQINSRDQLRENVINALQKQGFSEDVGHRVADAMEKEFKDIRGKILERAQKEQQRIKDTWTPKEKLPAEPKDFINERIDRWENYKKLEEDDTKPLVFTKEEAKSIVADAFKNSETFGKETAAGNRIDWLKMAQEKPDENAIRKVIDDHFSELGITDERRKLAIDSIKEIYPDVAEDIIAHANAILDARQKAIDREPPVTRTDLNRLAEYHDIGLFEGAHDQLLAHVLGIDPQDVQAIQGIKVYAEKLSKLRQLLSGNDFIVPSLAHTLNREIHSILAPLISNKTKTMRVVSAINKIGQLENSMLISTHGNILENHLSGALELLTSNINMRLKLGGELGGMKKQDIALMKEVYAHIAAGGAENGLAPYQVGGNKIRLTDEYNFHKMRGADWSNPKTWAKGIATTVLSIPRTFLSGADGSVKMGLMNIHLKGAVIDAMVSASEGKMSKDEAIEKYNDAIYGDGQLEKAKQKAEQLYKDIGLKYVSQRELNITAHELLRENLIQNRLIAPEELQEAMENSFKQAGLGMGHESNNPVSKKQEAYKKKLNQEENKAISEQDWNKAAKIRLHNTIYNDVLMRFAASRFNWAYIRLEQAGGGILTGLLHYSAVDKKYKNIDLLSNTEKAHEAAIEYQQARQKLFRGMVGLGVSMIGYGAAKTIAQAFYSDKNDIIGEDQDPMEAMFDELHDNYPVQALYLKVAPLIMLQSYQYNEALYGSEYERALRASLENVGNLTGFGDKYDPSVRLADALYKLKNKSAKVRMKGGAEFGSAFGSYLPHVPLVKQGKNVISLANWMGGGEPIKRPPYPQNFIQGLLGGGVVQDAFGLFPEDELPEVFKDWGKEPQQ